MSQENVNSNLLLEEDQNQASWADENCTEDGFY